MHIPIYRPRISFFLASSSRLVVKKKRVRGRDRRMNFRMLNRLAKSVGIHPWGWNVSLTVAEQRLTESYSKLRQVYKDSESLHLP